MQLHVQSGGDCTAFAADMLDAIGALFRGKADGVTLPPVAALARTLVPYLRRLAAGQHRSGNVNECLERLPCGMLLLDARGQVQRGNARALAIAASNDGLQTARGGLAASTPAATQALRAALAGCTGPAPHGAALALPRPVGPDPLAVLALPLQPRDGIAVALCVADTGDEAPAQDVWQVLYGLTQAEARLAANMLTGRTLRDIAAQLTISVESARTHIKHIMAKTNTHRQSDLVRLLLVGEPRLGG